MEIHTIEQIKEYRDTLEKMADDKEAAKVPGLDGTDYRLSNIDALRASARMFTALVRQLEEQIVIF